MPLKSVSFIKGQKNFANLVIYGLGQGFNLVTPLLVIPYIISVCGLGNYGIASYGMALTFFLIVFIDYGSDITGVKAVSTNRHDKNDLERIFTVTYAAKFIVLLAVLAIMTAIFLFVPYFSRESAVYFLGLPILVGQFLNPTWFLQGVENFTQITILNILSKVIYVIGIFVFIKSPQDFIYINLWWGIGMIVANGISFFRILSTHGFSFRSVAWNDIRGNLRSGFSIFSSQIFVSVQLYSPLILIGFFGNGTMAGMYKVVDQVVVIFKTYILLFFNFVYPRVCYLLMTDIIQGRKFWFTFNGLNFLFVLFGLGGVYLYADAIIAYFNPGDTTELAALLRIAVFVPALMAVTIPVKQLLLGFNMNRFYVRATVVIVLSNLALMILLLPSMQIFGVLISLIAVELITAAIYVVKIKNRLYHN